MAKLSIENREARKEHTVKKYAEKVKRIKEQIREGDDELKFSAIIQLNKLPRNASKSRLHRRCQLCGRPRGVYRAFLLCRICIRKKAALGEIPGLVKASW